MNVTINGETREVPDGLTVQALIEHLGLRTDATVAEINGSIVDRAAYSDRPIAAGDEVELVQFVGGG